MSWCEWCSKNCPNAEWNRKEVDQIIENSFRWVNIHDPVRVKVVTREVAVKVDEIWVSPCKPCLWVNDYLQEKKKS